jgi:hypothetical protein
MQRAKQVLQAFKVEMRELPREAAATYDAKAKAHHATLQKLHGDLQWAKTEGSAAAGGARNVDDMTSGEIIQEGAGIQDKSKAAVDRMKRQIEESKQARLHLLRRLRLRLLRHLLRLHRLHLRLHLRLHRLRLHLRPRLRRSVQRTHAS